MSAPASKYDSWTRQQLIDRLSYLESPSRPPSKGHHQKKPSSSSSPSKPFLFASYHTRKIALRFCYSGSEYGGLAYQTLPTPLPTVEGVLFDALVQAKFVDGEKGLEGCEWERCGRTDRGVSSAGQVVSVVVRTATKKRSLDVVDGDDQPPLDDGGGDDLLPSSSLSPTNHSLSPSLPSSTTPSHPIIDLPYLTSLNKLLPPTIRILAYSHVSPSFSARFSCLSRHYKYFFTSPSHKSLSIPLMRRAASLLVGEHDFRNMCKVDPAKQITSFRRRVLRAEISRVGGEDHGVGGGGEEEMYVLDLVGTAFLYHQVRHIMAILFLVGAGLEPPSIVAALLNISNDQPYVLQSPAVEDGLDLSELPFFETKPEYQMADGLPLVLWECAYRESDVAWRTLSAPSSSPASSSTSTSASSTARRGDAVLHTQLHSIWQRSRIHTILDAHFLRAAQALHDPELGLIPPSPSSPSPSSSSSSSSDAHIIPPSTSKVYSIPLGGGTYKRCMVYVPLVKRKRGEHVDVVNERWRVGKGARKAGRSGLGEVDGEGEDE